MLKVGTEVRGYLIEGTLGHGGMGIVYEARQISLDRPVALKILSPELSTDVSFRERFRREGQIQAAIDHPNIVTVHEAGEIDEGLFIAMRIVRGPTLKDMIIGRELEAARTLRILGPIADALDSAHGAGLIHRDIKPQNILVGARDHPYLADFGLTKGANEAGLTRTGQFVGTIDYISPEQIRGEHARPASDIYALAAVLYECLTGVVPYTKPSDAAVLFAHMSDPRPLVTEKRPDLPPELNDVIVKGMNMDPDERHQSATELIEHAKHAFGRRIRAALTPPGPIEVPEELGIREQEGKVPTRETRIREAAELADAQAAGETRAAAPAAPTDVTPAVEETIAKPAPENTIASPAADQTRPAPVVEPPPGQQETEDVPMPAEATRPAATPPAPPVPPAEATIAAAARPEPAAAAPPAAPPAEKERRGAPPFVPILVVAGLVAIVAGFLIGHSGGGDSAEPATLSNSATTADLGLNFPAGWEQTSKPETIDGLTFTRPLGLQKTGSSGTALTAGMTAGSGETLLPAAFLKTLASPPKTEDPVMLGKLAAYRYQDMHPTGFNGRLTVFVVPTTEGVATIACSRPATGGDGGDCESIAGSLRLVTAKAFALGPSKAYGASLNNTLSTLGSSRASLRKTLSTAKTPSGQASTATRLADAYTTAADSLAKLEVTPQVKTANAAIVTALQDTSSAYKKMASAASKQQRNNYNSASADVKAGETAVQRAVSDLEALGYPS